MKTILNASNAILLSILILSCSTSAPKDFISSAVVETQTYQVATTVSGVLLAVNKDEGQPTAAGEIVAIVDTVPLVFKLNEAASGIAELRNSIAAKRAEIASQNSDVAGIEREFKRIGDLADKGSAPSQQKDNLETQLNSAKLRIGGNRSLLASLNQKASGLDIQVNEIKDMLSRCYVQAPIAGTVLTKYKNKGEVVLPGNPVYELGNYDTMQVDFYVPQTILGGFKLGQAVRIRIDDQSPSSKQKQTFVSAHITWISSDAEFSPKNIQTRESRNELVFKIRALAANKDGLLKRGLPVEVWR